MEVMTVINNKIVVLSDCLWVIDVKAVSDHRFVCYIPNCKPINNQYYPIKKGAFFY